MLTAGVVVGDAETRDDVVGVLQSAGWAVSIPDGHGGTEGAGEGDLAGCDAVVCDSRATLGSSRLALRAVVLGDTAEEALRSALRIGAREAIAWPGERRLLVRAVRTAADGRTGADRDQRRIGITSARSCGATAFAAHLAAALVRSGADCIVVDCDLAHADLTGYLLDDEPSRSVEQAVVEHLSITDVLVESGVVRIAPAEGGRTLTSETMGALGRWVDVVPRDKNRIELFDLPCSWLTSIGDALPGALSWLDLVVMAVPLDFAGVRRARRIAEAWGGERSPELQALLIQQRRHGMAPGAALDATGIEQAGLLPVGGEALGEALDEGRLLGARPGTPYARAVEHLATRLAAKSGLRDGQPAEAKRASRIGSLFDFVASRAASA